MADDDDFLWSRQTYSLKHFVRNFEDKLPVLVNVTQGYCGVDELLDISKDQIYIVTDVKRQKRVVVQTQNDLSLSIPIDYPLDFVVAEDEDQHPESLESIIKKYDYEDEEDNLVIVPYASDQVSFACSVGAEAQKTVFFEELRVQGDYDDIFLVAVPVNHGHVHQSKVSIPVFVDIKVAQAKGVRKTTNKDYFDQILANLHVEATSFHCVEPVGNPEIMLYDGKIKHLSDYEYIEPRHYITCKQASDVRKQKESAKQHKLSTVSSGPEVPARPPRPGSLQGKNMRRIVPEPPKLESSSDPKEQPAPKRNPSVSKSTKTESTDAQPKLPPKPKPRPQKSIERSQRADGKYINVEHPILVQTVAPMTKYRPDSKYTIVDDTDRKETLVFSTSGTEDKHDTSTDDDDDAYEYVAVPTISQVPSAKPKVSQEPPEKPKVSQVPPTKPKVSSHPKRDKKPIATIHDTVTDSTKTSPATTRKAHPQSSKQADSNKTPDKDHNSKGPELGHSSPLDLSSFPIDLTPLSKYEVVDCLLALKLGKYGDAFLDQDIDGDLLSTLTDEQMFVDEFQFKTFEARKLVRFIKGWRVNAQAITKL